MVLSRFNRTAVQAVVEREVLLANKHGLHVRPAGLFVKAASRFAADIQVGQGASQVSGKSIMGLLTLGAMPGTRLRLRAEGSDAAEAIEALAGLIESNFDAKET